MLEKKRASSGFRALAQGLLIRVPKQNPPAKVVIEHALRRDFVRQVESFVCQLGNKPDLAEFPVVREHAFAKVPGNPPLGISDKKTSLKVTHRELLPSEKTAIHSHNVPWIQASAKPSLLDTASFVGELQRTRKRFSVISVFDLGPDYGALVKSLSTASYTAKQLPAKSRPQFSRAERAFLVSAAREAARQFALSGYVVLSPTKNLLRMPQEKREALCGLLEAGIEKSEHLSFGEFEKMERALEEKISREYGQLYRARFVPMKGYHYDSKLTAFVKD